jgi:hypothetical protein
LLLHAEYGAASCECPLNFAEPTIRRIGRPVDAQLKTIEGFDGPDPPPALLGRGDAVGGVGVPRMARHLSSIRIAGRRHVLGRAGYWEAAEPVAKRGTDMAAIL